MAKRSNIQVFTSGEILRLNEISSAIFLHAGMVNLFLVHRIGEQLGEHTFVLSLKTGDSLFPVSELVVGEDRYLLIACAASDCEFTRSPEADSSIWLTQITEAASHLSGRAMGSLSMDQLWLELIEIAHSLRSRRLELARTRQKVTQAALLYKTRTLGEVASLDVQSEEKEIAESDPLFVAVQEISRCYSLPFDHGKNELLKKGIPARQRLMAFCQTSQWRVRSILLLAHFYKQNSTPILAFRKSDQSPLVIFPKTSDASYFSPGGSTERLPFHADDAADIEENGYCFYEQFPAGKLTKKRLFHFLFAHAKHSVLLIGILGLAASLLGFATPIATAYVTGKIIPTANLPELWQLAILLTVLLICEIGIGTVPSLIMIYAGSRQFERFQAAVYDRILKIPVKAFQQCDAGDMAQRVLGATQVQSAFFSMISQQILAYLFAVTSLIMMFYYSGTLAFAGLGMVMTYVFIFVLLSRKNQKPLAEHAAAAGRLSGLLKQFFDGMAKIRAAGAEQRILSRFMDDFSIMVREEYKISTLGSYRLIFSMAFPLLIALLFYAIAGGMMANKLSLPVFLAFMAAFQCFQGGILGVTGGIWTLLAIRPEIDRMMPILEMEVEDDSEKHQPGILDGSLALSHVSFRYSQDSRWILDDVSLVANPGEFIAVVGSSGAGKSTLVRLLLGFEQVESGGIYYSGKDLAYLNLRAVRRQLGVILQNSKVIDGSILENITTGTECTIEEAWAALKLAAFADEVEEMPMGIHTLVTPDTISGGQQQRILIARALVGRPVAVIMDESTSALDNFAQQVVKQNMERLKMTRVIIAHRLSTIVNADRIYVLDKGHVVQVGTYSELASVEGVFRDLAARQQLTPEN